MKTEFSRQCPKCNEPVYYRDEERLKASYWGIEKGYNTGQCKSCASKARQIILSERVKKRREEKEKGPHTRHCPKCNSLITHKTAHALHRALRDVANGKMRKCRSCGSEKSRKIGQQTKRQRIADFLVELENCGDECIEFPNGRKTRNWGNGIINRHVMPKFHGKRPKDMVARHLCLNDSCAPNGFTCCNPKHLEWNTQLENVRDLWRWGGRARKKGKATPPPKGLDN